MMSKLLSCFFSQSSPLYDVQGSILFVLPAFPPVWYPSFSPVCSRSLTPSYECVFVKFLVRRRLDMTEPSRSVFCRTRNADKTRTRTPPSRPYSRSLRRRRSRRRAVSASNNLLSVLAQLARHPILCSPRDGRKLPWWAAPSV